jgi:hypothetical protein
LVVSCGVPAVGTTFCSIESVDGYPYLDVISIERNVDVDVEGWKFGGWGVPQSH